jgi:ribosomal protein L24E
MKPKPLKQRKIIKQHIRAFLDQFRPGDQLRTEDVYKYVRRMTGKQHYPGTTIRYMREMRQDGEINYTCTIKKERIIKILRPEEPHSL